MVKHGQCRDTDAAIGGIPAMIIQLQCILLCMQMQPDIKQSKMVWHCAKIRNATEICTIRTPGDESCGCWKFSIHTIETRAGSVCSKHPYGRYKCDFFERLHQYNKIDVYFVYVHTLTCCGNYFVKGYQPNIYFNLIFSVYLFLYTVFVWKKLLCVDHVHWMTVTDCMVVCWIRCYWR